MNDELVGGDYINGPGDYYRLLKRAREYLIEADRQLRGGGSAVEQEESRAWYAEMDAADEWTGITAAAHVACAQDIVLFFDDNPDVVKDWEGKPVLYTPVVGRPEWHKLRIAETLDDLRKDIGEMLVQVGEDGEKH